MEQIQKNATTDSPLTIRHGDLVYGRKEARHDLENTWERQTTPEHNITLSHVIADLVNNLVRVDVFGLPLEGDELIARDDVDVDKSLEKAATRYDHILQYRQAQLKKYEEELGPATIEVQQEQMRVNYKMVHDDSFLKPVQKKLAQLKENIAGEKGNVSYYKVAWDYTGGELKQQLKKYAEYYTSALKPKVGKETENDWVTRYCKIGLGLPAQNGREVKFQLGEYTDDDLVSVAKKQHQSYTDHELRAAYRMVLDGAGSHINFYGRGSHLLDKIVRVDTAADSQVQKDALKPMLSDHSKLYVDDNQLTDVRSEVLQVLPPWEWANIPKISEAWAAYKTQRGTKLK